MCGLVMRKPKAHSQQAEHSWGAECLNSRASRANQPSDACCNSSLVISLHVDHIWLHFNMSYITVTITGIDSKVCVYCQQQCKNESTSLKLSFCGQGGEEDPRSHSKTSSKNIEI